MAKLYSVADAARELGVAQTDVRECIADGTIQPEMPGGRYALTARDLDTLREEFLEAEANAEAEDDGDDYADEGGRESNDSESD